MLAGRKLLLADDSITIQKIVELTFADEGVSVVCVNNGREAIDWLEEFTPDVVLADVFMPQVSGYEVCQYIKQNEKLKHIPVMLLIGSFEPFDEAEARRVGANDTLTKPFQSIRRLLEKVGILVSEPPPEEQISTAELPKVMPHAPELEKLTEQEIALTTADTKELSPELRDVVDQASDAQARKVNQKSTADTKAHEGTMERKVANAETQVAEQDEGAGDVLLDLGDYAPAGSDDDFVLDIDLDEVQEPSPVESAYQAQAFISKTRIGVRDVAAADAWSKPSARDQLATTQDLHRPGFEVPDEPAPQEAYREASIPVENQRSETSGFAAQYPRTDSPNASTMGPGSDSRSNLLQQLSPEMIDAIARRAVELLSEKVVQEIAWEVVPQLAELMIKRQLEEKNS